tara:strand:- start:7640 stop:8089 length:450 start_codon:yes stop_codon:yes gene_type:complete
MIIKTVSSFAPSILFFLLDLQSAGISALIGSIIQRFFLYNKREHINHYIKHSNIDCGVDDQRYIYYKFHKADYNSLMLRILNDNLIGYSLILAIETLIVASSSFLTTPLILPTLGLILGTLCSKWGDNYDDIYPEDYFREISKHRIKFI